MGPSVRLGLLAYLQKLIYQLSAQTRQAIQTLEEAHDAIQTLHVGSTFIVTGSVDGHVRTYDLRMGELRSDFIGSVFYSFTFHIHLLIVFNAQDPITSILPTQDAQTLLVASLDNNIRLMDAATGKMLNDFTGHVNQSYRCRACFGHGEASVICGDENGRVWAWDLLDVSIRFVPPLVIDSLGSYRQRYYNQTLLLKFMTSSSPGRNITQ